MLVKMLALRCVLFICQPTSFLFVASLHLKEGMHELIGGLPQAGGLLLVEYRDPHLGLGPALLMRHQDMADDFSLRKHGR